MQKTKFYLKMEKKDYIKFKYDLISQINRYRNRHGVKSLRSDFELDKKAQNLADQLAKSNEQYTNQNLEDSIYESQELLSPIKLAKILYDDNLKYDYKDGSQGPSNFTRMVWKKNDLIGFGVQKDSTNKFIFVIKYFPSGNIPGEFQKNVFPFGTKFSEAIYINGKKDIDLDTNQQPLTQSNNENINQNYNENVPENNYENYNQNKNESYPQNYDENIPENNKENIPQQYNENTPEQYNQNIPEKYNENIPEQHNENIPEKYNENMPEQNNENIPQNYNENKRQSYNENKPQIKNENIPQTNNENIPQINKESIPENNKENLPQNNNENIPQSNKENISQNYNENIPQKQVEPINPNESSNLAKEKEEPTNIQNEKEKKITFLDRYKEVYNTFYLEALNAHNEYRKLHHAEPLTINRQLCRIAETYSRNLAYTIKELVHSTNTYNNINIGENLYSCRGLNPSGAYVTKKWYDEIKDYDYSTEVANDDIGHFTQVVWKATKEVGFGFTKNDEGKLFVVANYFPAGNTAGLFHENVLRP